MISEEIHNINKICCDMWEVMCFTYIITLFHIIINDNIIIDNFIRSLIHFLTSIEGMHGMFTILSIFPAFGMIMDVTFHYHTAGVIIDISIFRATFWSYYRSFRSLNKSINYSGKIWNFIAVTMILWAIFPL